MLMTATYSPEDNKLRLSASQRLDTELYARVRAAGFIWAPKQEIFVAPMWTPERADLLTELCGEIGDEDTSLVDRATARAERFEDYSESRADDAELAHKAVESITSGIPLGQPILVGHHSEKHARKDVERIENGMRRAIKMWETSKYWQSRAAGAIRAAKYKELPTVRARRIKGLEADVRSQVARYTPRGPAIMQCPWSWTPSNRELTIEQVDAERELARVPHVYVGPKGRGGYWTPEANLPGVKARAERWLTHLENRLVYERAMLAESGAMNLLDKAPRAKQLPICNYRVAEGIDAENIYHRGEMIHHAQVEMTQAQYSAINTDYKGTRVVENSHRVRVASVQHSSVCVFITDSKTHEKPGAAVAVEAPLTIREPRSTYVAPKPTKFDALKETLTAGVQVVSAPQLFPTPKEVARRMVELADVQPGETVLEPSAGTGSIVREIIESVDTEIVGYEINLNLVSKLTSTFPGYRLRARCRDFLEVTEGMGQFPVVLMNPPFVNAQDIAHIQHAMKFLKPGGRLVAICANGPRQQEKLKPLMDTWEDLPAGTFEESGTGVNTAMVTYTAPERAS